MAAQPPDGSLRPPDIQQYGVEDDTSKTQQKYSMDQHYTTTNLNNKPAIPVAISQEELGSVLELISQLKSGIFRIVPNGEDNTIIIDSSTTQNHIQIDNTAARTLPATSKLNPEI